VIIILGLPVVMDKSAKIQDFAVRQASWVVSDISLFHFGCIYYSVSFLYIHMQVSTGKKGIGIRKKKSATKTKEAVETETSVAGTSEMAPDDEPQTEGDNPSQVERSLSFGSTISARAFLHTIR